jgi:hypothetical protein
VAQALARRPELPLRPQPLSAALPQLNQVGEAAI